MLLQAHYDVPAVQAVFLAASTSPDREVGALYCLSLFYIIVIHILI